MSPLFPKTFFVTGTDTGVGKTVVSTILTLGLAAHYWKPIQSGGCSVHSDGCSAHSGRCSAHSDRSSIHPDRSSVHSRGGSTQFVGNSILTGENSIQSKGNDATAPDFDLTDSEFLARAGVPRKMILPERYCLTRPLSPHLSARLDGKTISLNDFSLPDTTAMNHLLIEGAGGLLVPINDRDTVADLIAHLGIPALLVACSSLGTINHTLLSLAAMREKQIDILGVVMTGAENEENRKAIEHFGKVNVIAQVPQLTTFCRDNLLACFAESFTQSEQVAPSLGARASGEQLGCTAHLESRPLLTSKSQPADPA